MYLRIFGCLRDQVAQQTWRNCTRQFRAMIGIKVWDDVLQIEQFGEATERYAKWSPVSPAATSFLQSVIATRGCALCLRA